MLTPCPLSLSLRQFEEVAVIKEMKLVIALLASVSNADGPSRVFGPDTYLDDTKTERCGPGRKTDLDFICIRKRLDGSTLDVFVLRQIVPQPHD